MTVGELSRRTGMPIKSIREYHDARLIYGAGRSSGNYRLFDESALWCIEVIRTLRSLGLTVNEIRELAGVYLDRPDQPVGPHLAERLRAVRARIEGRMAELQDLRRRIDDFEVAHAAALAGGGGANFRGGDPRFRPRAG